MRPASEEKKSAVTWVRVGVWTEKSAQTTGLEKRVRSAVEKNGMNMLYSSIIQRQKEGGE
jgi:hypothetical protein